MAGVRWWQGEPSWRAGLAYALLATAFYAPGLWPGRHQIATDIAYWSGSGKRRGTPFPSPIG